MTSRKTKTPTPVEAAQAHVQEVESTISALADEIAPLVAEREQLQGNLLLQPAEVDRLADLADGSLPRREEYLTKLRRETLPDAQAALRRVELLALAEDGVDGIATKRRAWEESVAASEAVIAEELEKIRQATEEWNSFLTPALAAAVDAGQDDRDPVDHEHPVTVHLDSLNPRRPIPLHLTVGGTDYRRSDVEAILRRTVGRGDSYLGRLLRQGHDEDVMTEVRRGRWS